MKNPDGGRGWIRTTVRSRGQIYSLLPLTTRPPFQPEARLLAGKFGGGKDAVRPFSRASYRLDELINCR